MWDGTLILTSEGPLRIEELAPGTLVQAWSGDARRVASVTRHGLDDPAPRAEAIRIVPGALDEGCPDRSIDVPADVPVALNGAHLQARLLANGATIAACQGPEETHRWEITFEGQDAGTSEPFQPLFHDKGCIHAAPDHAWAEDSYELLIQAKRRLLERAIELGHETTEDPLLHLEADGVAIEPRSARDNRYLFRVPAGARNLKLVSRVWAPAEMVPESADIRSLGVCVRRIVLDGHEHDLADLDDGWHALEDDGSTQRRWTNGSAMLPARTATFVDLQLWGGRRYWVQRVADVETDDDASGRPPEDADRELTEADAPL